MCRGSERASMSIAGRGRRVGRNGVGFLMGFRPHRLDIHLTHVTFAAALLANRGALNATPNAQVGALGIVPCPIHVGLFIDISKSNLGP